MRSPAVLVPGAAVPAAHQHQLIDQPADPVDRPHPAAAVPFKSLDKPTAHQNITILIGPEAGFDANEVTNATDAGFTSTLLGPRILRTESAGLATIAALQTMWGDF